MNSESISEEKFIDLNGLSFHYIQSSGNGRPIVLLHGLASNAHFWDLASPHMNDHFNTIALDQRGHGGSAKTEEGYDFPNVASDVASFINSLGIENPILVGHSWGGNVAVQVAADNPGLLSGLVCIDGGLIEPSSRPGANWEDTEKALAPPDFAALKLTWDQFLDRMKGAQMGNLWGPHLETFARANFEIQPDGTVLPYLRRHRHMKIVRAPWDQKVSELFPRISCPVLLMPARKLEDANGDKRIDTKERAIEKALKLIPTAKVVWMEDSVHDVPVQKPELVAQVIVNCATEKFF